MFECFWAEWLWFPEKLKVGWKDLENKPGTGIYYPVMTDLHWSLALGVVFVAVRYILARVMFIPLGYCLGVPRRTKQHTLAPHPALEAAYRLMKTPSDKETERLCKVTDMTERQVQIWFRKRKQNEGTKAIHKFSECGWHGLFYSAALSGGLYVLWDTPWLADTEQNWIGWPFQHVPNSIYWYYMLECAFYWSLVFTLCVDHRRKDFKEMAVHHVATLSLIYFSWMLNFVRVGSLVLLVHDASDPFLALAKMMTYVKNGDGSSTVFFVCFLLVWCVCRLYVYPFVVLYSTTIQFYVIMEKTFFTHWFFNALLYALMFLHLMWTYSIFKSAIIKLSVGKIKDVRSDSEDTESGDDISKSCQIGRLSTNVNDNVK